MEKELLKYDFVEELEGGYAERNKESFYKGLNYLENGFPEWTQILFNDFEFSSGKKIPDYFKRQVIECSLEKTSEEIQKRSFLDLYLVEEYLDVARRYSKVKPFNHFNEKINHLEKLALEKKKEEKELKEEIRLDLLELKVKGELTKQIAKEKGNNYFYYEIWEDESGAIAIDKAENYDYDELANSEEYSLINENVVRKNFDHKFFPRSTLLEN